MRTISATELRNSLAATLDKVVDDHEAVIVTRGEGKPPVVLLSLEDYGALEETEYLLRSPKNRERLLEAVAELGNL